MGMTKRFQEEKTQELANKLGIKELYFYEEYSPLATMASAYAQYKLETEEGDIQAARRRIKVNLDVKPDEAIDLIQRMLECACGLDGSILCGTVACAGCTFSPLCLEYWKYQYEHG